MLHSLFKRRIGFALAFALVVALMLPAAALGEETSKPKQHSERTQTVYCSTTTTTEDGKTTTNDCSKDGSGVTFSSDNLDKPSLDVDLKNLDAGSVTPDTMDTWLDGMMNDLFWTE